MSGVTGKRGRNANGCIITYGVAERPTAHRHTPSKQIGMDPEEKRPKLQNPNPDGCQQWVERKKRWCRMTVAKGNTYCGEHSRERAVNTDQDAVKRIPCPLDPKHSVFTDKLEKHLRICNAREQPKPDFIQKDVNAGSDDEEGSAEPRKVSKLSDLDPEYLKVLVGKVKAFYSEIKGEFDSKEEIKYHSQERLEEELQNPSYGQETLKHLKQTSALIGSMERLDLIKEKTCYIEFGAGKGQVSYYLATSLDSLPDTDVLLVDRASMRFKLDNKCRDKSFVHRIRADIADLDLKAVSHVQGKERIVGVSKHLCGAATDLAIRCMTQIRDTQQAQSLVIAVCCHHRCTWKTFVGKREFLKHQLTKADFDYVIKMVSWAVCGEGMSKERRKLVEDQEAGLVPVKDVPKQLPWTREEQEEIGYMCKRIIDYGRLQYLKDMGYRTGAFYYITKDITLENMCIFANLEK